MTRRRTGEPIQLAPMPTGERLVLSLYRSFRPHYPDVHGADDPLSWWWLAPMICEGLAPLPARNFDHVSAVLARPELGETRETGRN